MRLLFALTFSLMISGCAGYGWQAKTNPWKDQGLEKVYVEILLNNSLRPGAEVPFTSAFVRQFSRGNKLKVVRNREDADLVVEAAVESIDSQLSSTSTVPSLTDDKAAAALSDMVIATEYAASATVSVKIVAEKKGSTLITQTFNRSKIYPGNNRFGLPGTTSVLINDSQMQLALNEVADSIASDAYDTLLEAF